MLAAVLLLSLGQLPAPTHEWRLTADHIAAEAFTPTAGTLRGHVAGPIKFGTDSAKALVFDGDSKKKHGLILTDRLAEANLPVKEISVEAWVMVDKAMEWGGLVGALQDNGSYEKGWLLGFNHTQFCFALAASKDTLTYLKAKTHFQKGYWYHVVGTYDGIEQRLYINGKFSASSTEQKGPIAYPPKGWVTLGVYKDDDEHHTLSGQMQAAAIWNIALSEKQVAERFAKRKGDFPNMDATPPVVSDWPVYLRDNLRTGATPDTLKPPLHLAWTHEARHPPAPAWPEEAKNDYWHNKYSMEERVTYDRAFHLVSVGERVYFGSSSDDSVHCLDAATGKTKWTFTTEGPVRLAPTIAKGKALFGSDDGFVYCVNADDGKLVWKKLLAPSPRRIPGNSRIISAWPVRTDVLVEGEKAFVCAGVFPSQGTYQYTLDVNTGEELAKKTITVTAQGYQQRMFGKLMIGTGRNPQGAFVGDLAASGRDIDREANKLPKEFPYAFIAAGTVRYAGGDGKVAAFDAESGKKLWEAPVKGKAFSVIAVRDRLMVSTDLGFVHCFTTTAGTPAERLVDPVRRGVGLEGIDMDHQQLRANQEIGKAATEAGGKSKGYVLVLGLDRNDVRIRQLVINTDFDIIVREPDAERAAGFRFRMRDKFADHRVHVHTGDLDSLPYTDGLFNIVFFPPGFKLEKFPDEVKRVTRPGGVVFRSMEKWEKMPRLEGEGEWTHQYGDPGNTACSKDDRLAGELMLQWFGKPGPKEMIDRHHRTAAPVYKNGRLFVPGEDRVIAVDGYNGTILWDQLFPDSRRVVIFRDASYLCVDDNHLFVASKNSVQLVHPETGKTEHEFAVPKELGDKRWGYVARPGNVLLGSAVRPGSSRTIQSAVTDRTETYYDYVPLVGADALFALDPKTGKTLWTHTAKGLIPHPAIAADATTVYFLESRNARTLETKLGRAKMFDLCVEEGIDAVAIDLATGKQKWRKEVNLTKLDHIAYLVVTDGRLIISGSRNSTRDKKTGTVWYDIQAFDPKTGERLWSVTQDQKIPIGGDHGEQDQHPVIVGNKLYQEPYAYDLAEGSRIDWKWPWAGRSRRGCGNITASNNQFFFRDDTTAMFDLAEGVAKKVTTETRPGCWVNVLPVGGLVLAPEASSGCSCNFAVQTSLALIPVRKK